MSISVHVCGDPNGPRLTEQWMRDIVEMEGVLGYSIIADVLRHEEEWREHERELDIRAEQLASCQSCSGMLEHACPELEFDDHDEGSCPYDCSDGSVLCHCVFETLQDKETE